MVKVGTEDPFFPGVNTLGWLGILDIRNGVVFPALLCTVFGALYGVVVYFIWTQFNLEAPWLPTFFSDHGNFVAFLVTFFVAGSFSKINGDIDTLRSVQGGGYANFFLKLRTYVSEDDPELYVIRDIAIAASWAAFSGLLPDLQEEALDRISALIPEGTLSDIDTSILAKIGKGGFPIGGAAATKMLFMAAQRFEKAAKRTGEKRGLGDAAVQMQISETHANLMILRGQFGTMGDRSEDSYGLHIAYIQLLGLAVSCMLTFAPWGRVEEFGAWVIISCAFEYFILGGMFLLGTDMINPYKGFVRINLKKLLVEIDNSWTPYQS